MIVMVVLLSLLLLNCEKSKSKQIYKIPKHTDISVKIESQLVKDTIKHHQYVESGSEKYILSSKSLNDLINIAEKGGYHIIIPKHEILKIKSGDYLLFFSLDTKLKLAVKNKEIIEINGVSN
jgi:hypothetical protein